MGQLVGLSLLAFLRPSMETNKDSMDKGTFQPRAPRTRARARARRGSPKKTMAEKQSGGQGLFHGNLYAGSAA